MKDLGNTPAELEARAPEDVAYLILYQDGAADYEDFTKELGGHFFLVENEEDLRELYLHKDTPPETALDFVWEHFDWSFDGDHIVAFDLVDNDGGPTYWIPKELALDNPVIEAVYRNTNGAELSEKMPRGAKRVKEG